MIDVILGWAMWLGLVITFAVAWFLADIASNLWQERRREKRTPRIVIGSMVVQDPDEIARRMRDRRDETARWQAMRDGFERGER